MARLPGNGERGVAQPHTVDRRTYYRGTWEEHGSTPHTPVGRYTSKRTGDVGPFNSRRSEGYSPAPGKISKVPATY